MSQQEPVKIPERPIEFATKALTLAVRHDADQIRLLEQKDEAALEAELDEARRLRNRWDAPTFAVVLGFLVIGLAGVTGMIGRLVPPWAEYSLMGCLFLCTFLFAVFDGARRRRFQEAVSKMERCHQMYLVASAIRESMDVAIVKALSSDSKIRKE